MKNASRGQCSAWKPHHAWSAGRLSARYPKATAYRRCVVRRLSCCRCCRRRSSLKLVLQSFLYKMTRYAITHAHTSHPDWINTKSFLGLHTYPLHVAWEDGSSSLPPSPNSTTYPPSHLHVEKVGYGSWSCFVECLSLISAP